MIVEKHASSSKLEPGAITEWTLTLHSSEYRYNTKLEVTDTLPSGLCPIAEENLSFGDSPECQPSAEHLPSPGYASHTEEPGGTWLLAWNIAELGHDQTTTVTFASRTRTHYQLGPPSHEAGGPILANDAIENTASVHSTANVICSSKQSGPTDCPEAGEARIDHEGESTSAPVSDHSAAGQASEAPVLRKEVALEGSQCAGATYSLSEEPVYHPGDRVCWQITLEFPSRVETKGSTLTDFIPTHGIFDESLNGGKGEAATANDTLPNTKFTNLSEGTESEHPKPGGRVSWELSESGYQPAKAVFQRQIATEATIQSSSKPGELQGNLVTFSTENTAGDVFSLRASSAFKLEYPELTIAKSIVAVDGKAVGPTGERTVQPGSEVTYRVTVSNASDVEAKDVEVRDLLPAQLTCAQFVSATAGGECASAGADFVHWGEGIQQPVTVAAHAQTSLETTVEIPANAGPANEFADTAGVRRFSSETNLHTLYEYTPTKNIDPTVEGEANAPEVVPAKALVRTENAAIEKTHTTARVEPGNGEREATIGELVTFKVPVHVPAAVTLGGTAKITDPLIGETGRFALVGASTEVKVVEGGKELTALEAEERGFTAGEETLAKGNAPDAHLPLDYRAPAGGTTVTLTFRARVTNTAENKAAASIPNVAHLKWEDPLEKTPRELSSSENATPVVEPQLTLSESNSTKGEPVHGGQIVEYKLALGNATGQSTAFATSLVAKVAAGVTPTDAGGKPLKEGETTASGGTWNETLRTITWAVAELRGGKSEALAYFAKVDEQPVSGNELKDSAKATTASLPAAEEQPRTASNATVNKTRYEAASSGELKVAGATVTKSASPAQGTIGTPVTYTVEVTIPANVVSYDTTVIDPLPAALDFVSYGEIKCTAGCPLEAKTYAPKYEAASTKIAWWLGSLAASTEVRKLKLQFVAAVRNTLLGGSTKVKAGETITNSVTANFDRTEEKQFESESIPSHFTNTSPPAEAKTSVVEPSLAITKEASVEGGPYSTAPFKVQVGQAVSYRVKVTNNGTSPAYDATISDTVPGQLTEVKAKETAGVKVLKEWSSGHPEIEWQLEDGAPLAPKATLTLEYGGVLALAAKPQQGEHVTNTAAVTNYWGTSEAVRGEGQTNHKGEAIQYREYTGPQAEVQGTVELPLLEVTKVPARSSVAAGEADSYSITIKDASAAPAHEVLVEDTLPAGMTYEAGQAKAQPAEGFSEIHATEASATWKIALLRAGARVTITVPVNVDAATPPGSELTNRVAAHSEEAPTPAEAAGTVKVTASADLSIEKSAAPDPATAGEPLTYTLKVHNAGPSQANAVKVTDKLPAGVEYLSASQGCSESSGTITCETGHLPVAGNASWEIRVRIQPDQLGTISNTAKVASETPDPEPENNHSTAETEIKGSADVSIEKSAAPDPATAGEPLAYTLKVHNAGPSQANAVKVTDKLPAGVEYLSASQGCSESSGTITCETGHLPVAGNATWEIRVRIQPDQLGTISNTAKVASETPDPEPENNHSTAETEIKGSADLSIEKSAAPDPATAGEPLTYTLKVHNAGPSQANAVKVTDKLPAGVEYLSASQGCSESSGTITCEAPVLAVGARASFEILVRVDPGRTAPIDNTATVASETPDPEPGNNESRVQTPVGAAADLSIVKRAPASAGAGEELAYTLLVANAGPSTAVNATVTDVLPEHVSYVSSSAGCALSARTVSCKPGDIEVGHAVELTITVRIEPTFEGTIANTASVTSETPDPEPENNQSTVHTEVELKVDLALQKTAAASVSPGETITWTLTGENRGPSTATDVKLDDPLPSGVTYISYTISKGSCSYTAPTVACELGSLAPGEGFTATITALVTGGPGSVTNKASLQSREQDTETAGNTSSATTHVTPRPHVSLTKRAAHPTVRAGGKLGYTLVARNSGPGTAFALVLCDAIPPHTSVTGLGGGTLSHRELCWRLPSLARGASHSFHVTLRFDSTDHGVSTNHALLSGANFAEQRARARVRVIPAAAPSPAHGVTG